MTDTNEITSRLYDNIIVDESGRLDHIAQDHE